MKKILISLFLSTLFIGSCYAEQWTVIRTPGNPVQCNNWGWVEGNIQTVWGNPCAPLEVKSNSGKVSSIASTANQCKDDQAAIYTFDGSNINFIQCVKHPKKMGLKSSH